MQSTPCFYFLFKAKKAAYDSAKHHEKAEEPKKAKTEKDVNKVGSLTKLYENDNVLKVSFCNGLLFVVHRPSVCPFFVQSITLKLCKALT